MSIPLQSPEETKCALQFLGAQADTTDAGRLEVIRSYRSARVQIGEHQHTQFRQRQARGTRCPGERIRVLYVSVPSGFSGAEASLVRMISAFLPSEVEASALTSVHGTFTNRLEASRVHVICPQRDISELSLPNLEYVINVLRDQKPDIVHFYGLCGPTLTIAAGLTRIPVVQHLRNAHVDGLRDAMLLASRVVVVSHCMRDRLRESMDIDDNKLRVIYSGIDAKAYFGAVVSRSAARQRFGICEDKKVVLMIARFARNKRHDTIIEAFAAVRRAHPDAELVLVGEVDHPWYRRRIEEMVRQYNLEQAVRFIGFQEDIRWIEAAADVQVLCSENEPLGICALESLALGIPAVVSNGGGLRELIEDGRHGFVVNTGDARGFADRLCTILADDELRAEMGRQGRQLVSSRLTSRHCAEQMFGIYNEILGGQGN